VKIYLTSSTDSDLTQTAVSLGSAGVDLLIADQVGSAGGWLSSLDATLAGCDAVVAVVAPPVSDATLLEIGVAIGRGVPVVIVVESDEGRQSLPIALRELPIITTGGSLEAFVDRLVATVQTVAASAGRPAVFVEGPREAEYLRAVSARLPENEIARRAAAVFISAGAKIYSDMAVPGKPTRRVDFAVWLPGTLEPAFNPVVVEVKQAIARNSVAQIQSYLAALNLVLGLLVTIDDAEPTWHLDARTAVGSVGIATLQAMTPAGVRAFLSTGRNRLVHGIR
jgi:hypothetical protein